MHDMQWQNILQNCLMLYFEYQIICLLSREGEDWNPRLDKQDLYWVLVTFAYIWKDSEERDKFQKEMG